MTNQTCLKQMKNRKSQPRNKSLSNETEETNANYRTEKYNNQRKPQQHKKRKHSKAQSIGAAIE